MLSEPGQGEGEKAGISSVVSSRRDPVARDVGRLAGSGGSGGESTLGSGREPPDDPISTWASASLSRVG